MQYGREIASEYQLIGARRAHIKLARYGRSRPLTIDPLLVFSTYFGGQSVDTFTGLVFAFACTAQ
jgi:hypothetical protein